MLDRIVAIRLILCIGLLAACSSQENLAGLAARAAVPAQGCLDAVTCDFVAGWARDPDWKSSINVHVYLDNVTPDGIWFSDTANKYRTDVGEHAYHHVLANQEKRRILDGKTHQVYVYAIGKNANGDDDGINALLDGSPMQFGPCDSINTTNPSKSATHLYNGTNSTNSNGGGTR